jgi:drug/metabolite transporter (DMT)-like permease
MFLNFASKFIARSTDGPRHVLLSARFGLAFLFLIPVFLMKNRELNTKHLLLHFLRALIICIIIFLTYVGHKILPISVAGTISTTEPIFVAIWSCLLGYETVESAIKLFLIVVLSLMGILLIFNPTFDQTISISGISLLLFNNFICGGTHFLSRKLAKTDSSITTLIYNILFINSFMLSINILLALTGNGVDFKSLIHIRNPILMLGVFAVVNSWLGLTALKKIDPNIHANIQNLSLPLSMVLGKLQGEVILKRNLVGSGLILLSVILLQKNRAKTKF